MTTYTLAFSDDLLIATVATGADIDTAIRAEEERAGETFENIRIINGVTLTDEEPDDLDRIIYSGSDFGWLTDESGRTYEYAIK